MDQDRINMIFERLRESSGVVYNQTSLTGLGFVVLLLLGLAILTLPRRYSILPLVALACFIPAGQRIVVATLDFTLLRILVLFGWSRILLRREDVGFSFKTIDKVFIAWSTCSAITYVLLRGDSGSMIYKLGGMFDAIGVYFLFRILIRDWDDLFRVVKYFMILSIPVAIFFLIEFKTGRNLFSILGGVPEITKIRVDRLRCQGPYVHPIAAGVFWASMFPLFVVYMRAQGTKFLAFLGIVSSLMIIVFCASSTPVASAAAAIAALLVYPFRRFMRLLRWGAAFAIVGLHFAMESPVWSLIGRTDLVGGSTGYHRYQLINQTILRFDEWWALGTRSTADWGHFLFDVANMYVSQAVRGGLATLILFIIVLTLAFRGVGRMLRLTEREPLKQFMCWVVGVSIFSHCVSFIALNYSHQNEMVFFMMLAITASLAPLIRRAPAVAGSKLISQPPLVKG